MTGIEFLIIVAIVSIILIIAVFIFNTIMFMNLKSYHDTWEPIYENRKEHFDIYLNTALSRRQEHQSIEHVAWDAANINYTDKCIKHAELKEMNYTSKKLYINNLYNGYLHELRCARIE